MKPQIYKLAIEGYDAFSRTGVVCPGSPMNNARYEGAKIGYLAGFGDGVEYVTKTSSSLIALQNSISVKDVRLDILEKENKHLKTRLEYRMLRHHEAEAGLKTIIDRLTLVIGLKDPKLLDQMQEIRKILE